MLVIDQINSINPQVKYKEVIARTITKACKYYNVPKNLYTAILAQESMFRVSPKGGDHGMSQIYHVTARRYHFNEHKLNTNFRYSIYAGARVLSDFKKMYQKREPRIWWTRYNSSKKKYRIKYYERVSRYLFMSVN